MAEFVIVGGGIYGCAVAWQLARAGAEVCLLEAKTIAAEASGGLGKRGVRANGRDLRELPLMRLAYERWPRLADDIAAPTGYEQCGHLDLIERPRDYAAATARVWTQTQQGIPTRLIEREELLVMEPHLGEAVQAAIYCPLDGVSDHTATTRGLARAAQQLGADIREHSPVRQIEHRAGRVVAVQTDRERIVVGRHLVLLANAAVPDLLARHFQLILPVWTALPQALFTAPIDPVPVRHLIGHTHRTLAMKATPDDRVMISGGWRGRWNKKAGRGETNPDQVTGNHAEAVAVYPRMAEIPLTKALADRLETMCIDGIPIIDMVTGVDNLTYAVGWSGHGWAIAPAVAEYLATGLLESRLHAGLRPFQRQRFFH